jgi:hypothetical protein
MSYDNNPILFTSINKENIYWDCNGKIPQSLNASLQKSLGLNPLITLNYSLLNSKNVHTKRGITPKNNFIGRKGMKARVIYYF